MKRIWERNRFNDGEPLMDSDGISFCYDAVKETTSYYNFYLEGRLLIWLSKRENRIIEGDDFRTNKHQSDFWGPE